MKTREIYIRKMIFLQLASQWQQQVKRDCGSQIKNLPFPAKKKIEKRKKKPASDPLIIIQRPA